MDELRSNTLTAWITALIIFAVVFSIFVILKTWMKQRVKRSVVPPTHIQGLLRDLVKRTRPYFILVVSLWAGSLSLTLDPHHAHVWHLVVMVVVLLQAGVWAGGLILFWAARIVENREADPGTRMTINVVAIAVRVVLWLIVLLVILNNLGINVTTLVTGLGIGGIAIALALQNILGDLFAALSIVIDKPFVVGDAINVGDAAGTVESIGLKSTRLRSISGEMIIISNGDLLKSRIRNYRGQEKRLVVLKLGIAHGTSADRLARVPAIIRAAAEREKSVKFDRSNFATFGMFALVTESVYSMNGLSYAEYMNTQERINLEIYRQLSAESIEIAHQPPMVTANPEDQLR